MTNEEITTTLLETEARSKSNTKRIDKIEQKQDEFGELVTSVALLAQEQKNVSQRVDSTDRKVDEIRADVKDIMAKPARKWEDFIGKLFWFLIVGALGYALAQLGIS